MRNFIFVSSILLLLCFSVYGQISTNEKPVSFRTNMPTFRTSENTHKSLPQLDMPKIEKEDTEDEANGLPPRFGYKYKVNYNLENSGEWTELPNGDRIWRLSIILSRSIVYQYIVR